MITIANPITNLTEYNRLKAAWLNAAEGASNGIYLDSVGVATIGIGWNISAPDNLIAFVEYGGDDDVRDQLFGGAGNDTLVAGSALDLLSGGSGNDIYILDTHKVQTTAPVSNNSIPQNPVNGLAFTASETGTSSSTTSTAITIDDLDGDNTIALIGVNNIGDDVGISAFDDNLVLHFASNQSVVIHSGMSHQQTITTASSAEQMMATPVAPLTVTDETFLNGNPFAATGQVDTLSLALNHLTDAVTATASSANTYLVGGLVNDSLTANSSGSTLVGGRGADKLMGGLGDDTYLIRKGDSAVSWIQFADAA